MSTGFPDEPGSREPGLDHLIKALTADGYPHELAGRDAALTAFRAARRRPRWAGVSVRRSRPVRLSMAAQLGVSARLAAVAAALIAALAGVTAAAYAKALPAPVQHIAYSVFANLGVPDNQPSAPAPAQSQRPTPPRGPVSTKASGTNHGTAPSPSASGTCPCPSRTSHPVVSGSVLTIAAARAELPANGHDAFSGKLTYHGHPEAGVRLLLLERAAGAAGWHAAGTGVTGKYGRIRIGVPNLTENATFRLSGQDGVASPEISVTVIPRVLLWRDGAKAGTDRLITGARFGDPGDAVVLQELSGSAWQDVATGELNASHRASFDVPAASAAGQYFRVVLRGTAAHGASVSNRVLEPRIRAAIGARAIMSHRAEPGPVTPHLAARDRPRHPVLPSPDD